MRGDLCPFDHGCDPVIVDDMSLPNVLPFPPPAGGFLSGQTFPSIHVTHYDLGLLMFRSRG